MPSLYIDGQWIASGDGTCSAVINPSDGTMITEVDVATDEQVGAAIAAARRAFDTTDWSRTPTGERAALLDSVAGLIDRDQEAMALEETLNTGKAMRESRWDMADVARVFRYYADLADKEAGRLVDAGNPDVVSRIVYEPVGVCGLIGPWNYPLLQMSWKIAPALAAGNTAVMKPAQVTPLSAIHLTRLLEEAGVPAGVVNLILGPGPRVGQALADSPDVDLVSLTGGLDAGRALMRGAAVNVKKVALELGGKSPNIVFADADFETAVDNALTAAFVHSGQVCSAGCRAIVEDGIYDRFVEEVGRRADRIRLGHGTDEATEAGALITAAHRDQASRTTSPPRSLKARGWSPAAGGPTSPSSRPASSTARRSSPTSTGRCGSSARRSSDRSSRSSGSRPRPRPSSSAMTRRTDWPARSGRPTRAAHSASRLACATGPCGSTTTTRTCRRPNGAASSNRASGGNLARAVWTNTVRPSTSGRTRHQGRRAGSEADAAEGCAAAHESKGRWATTGLPTVRGSRRYSAGISEWMASRSTPCPRRIRRAAMYTIAAAP